MHKYLFYEWPCQITYHLQPLFHGVKGVLIHFPSRGSNSCQIVLSPFWKGSTLIRKSLLPLARHSAIIWLSSDSNMDLLNVRTNTVRRFAARIINTYHAMGILADDKLMIFFFLIIPRKWDLTLHANCLLRRQFAWSVKSYFLRKKEKKYFKILCAEKFYPVCKVKG